MAIFFGGDKIQASGYKPLTVNSCPVNAIPSDVTIMQAFCLYRVDGKILELVGGLSTYAKGSSTGYTKQDVLTLPSGLAGSYTLDKTQSTYSGTNANPSFVGGFVLPTLSNNVLTIQIGGTSGATYGGSAIFHLFYTKN